MKTEKYTLTEFLRGFKMKRTLFLLGLIVVLLAPVSLSYAAKYTITNGTTQDLEVFTIKNTTSATSYYGWDGNGGNPLFGAEKNTGFLWLYENTSTGDVSLSMLFDSYNTGTWGEVSLTFSGFPSSAFVELIDDSYDSLTTSAGYWLWGRLYNDGGIIGGLNTNDLWTVSINLLKSRNISSWVFLSGTSDPAKPDRIAINFNNPLIITDPPETNAVPEPSTLILLGAGLLGFGVFASRRRK